MHGLSPEQLKELNKWPDARLIDAFEGYSDRVYLIGLQDASGIPHKGISDPDVVSLITTYDALKAELQKRLKLANKELATTLEGHSRAIAHRSARGVVGVPDDEKSDAQIAQAKDDYNSTYALIATTLSR